jgi:hypothetical protein
VKQILSAGALRRWVQGRVDLRFRQGLAFRAAADADRRRRQSPRLDFIM